MSHVSCVNVLHLIYIDRSSSRLPNPSCLDDSYVFDFIKETSRKGQKNKTISLKRTLPCLSRWSTAEQAARGSGFDFQVGLSANGFVYQEFLQQSRSLDLCPFDGNRFVHCYMGHITWMSSRPE